MDRTDNDDLAADGNGRSELVVGQGLARAQNLFLRLSNTDSIKAEHVRRTGVLDQRMVVERRSSERKVAVNRETDVPKLSSSKATRGVSLSSSTQSGSWKRKM